MSAETKGLLGDRLVERGLLSTEQLDVALAEQRRAHRPLGDILASLGLVGQEVLAELLAEDLELPIATLDDLDPDELLTSALDPSFVRETGAFPVRMDDGRLTVAMVDPGDPDQVALLRERFPFPLDLRVVTPGDLALLLRRHAARGGGELARVLEEHGEAEEVPADLVVEALLRDAARRGATDVHVEPDEHVVRVRLRLDGILQQAESLPRSVNEAIVSRIKVLARMDVSERRRPQDGRILIELDGGRLDLRVSTMPCVHGENVVLRLLDGAGGFLRLGELGIEPDTRRALHAVTQHPHGLFLVTGPTGSGKTTTLYALLAEVDSVHRNVATVEDPVEYSMPLARQSQVDRSIGFTFHAGIRTLLRQDPDVILVGEIRDEETASAAVQAAMTGHLVLSTLHTNTALGALPRLVDLGVEPFLVGDTLIGVLGQRLVRRVCEGCAAPHSPDDAEQAWLGDDIGTPRLGAGCELCAGTGYAGRTTIAELFLPDAEIAAALRDGGEASARTVLSARGDFRTMVEDGKAKVRAGTTTFEEVRRVERSHWLSEGERGGL